MLWTIKLFCHPSLMSGYSVYVWRSLPVYETSVCLKEMHHLSSYTAHISLLPFSSSSHTFNQKLSPELLSCLLNLSASLKPQFYFPSPNYHHCWSRNSSNVTSSFIIHLSTHLTNTHHFTSVKQALCNALWQWRILGFFPNLLYNTGWEGILIRS